MNNSQYGSSSSQYNTSGNINYAPSSSSTHKSQKKSLRGGINEASDRVELSAYATYAAHLQNSDNKSKNLHKNVRFFSLSFFINIFLYFLFFFFFR